MIRQSSTCHGCSIRSSGVGSSITGVLLFGALPDHACAPGSRLGPAGLSGNTRSCVPIYDERHTHIARISRRAPQPSATGRLECGGAPSMGAGYESRALDVQFRQGLGVIFPGATHRLVHCLNQQEAGAEARASCSPGGVPPWRCTSHENQNRLLPQWSGQKRPTVVRLKPANGLLALDSARGTLPSSSSLQINLLDFEVECHFLQKALKNLFYRAVLAFSQSLP